MMDSSIFKKPDNSPLEKRICFVTTVPVTIRSFLLEQTNLLVSNGWNVTWATSSAETLKGVAPDRVKIINLPLSRTPNIFQMANATIILRKEFKSEHYSVVQYCSPIASFISSISAYLSGIPIRIYAQWGIRYTGFAGLKRMLFKFLEKCTCAASTHIQPDSFGNLNFSNDEGLYPKSKGQVIGNGSAKGIDKDVFDYSSRESWRSSIRKEAGIPDTAFLFGFVGSIRKDKGINEAVSAFLSLLKNNDAILYFMLVGDMDMTADLDDVTIEALKENSNIITPGPQTEIQTYYAAFDALVFVSHREGFGMAVIEAAAMATPAIVSDIIGPSEAVHHNETGVITPVGDIEALRDRMEEFASNQEQTNALGINARKKAIINFERRNLMKQFLDDKNKKLEACCKKR